MVRSLPQPLTLIIRPLDVIHVFDGLSRHMRYCRWKWAFLSRDLSWKGCQYYHTAFGSWVADCSFACQPRRSTKLSNGCERGSPPDVPINAPALHAFDDIDIIVHVSGRYTLTEPTSLHNSQCLSLPEMSVRSDARLTCLYCTRRYSRKSVSVSCDVTRVGQRC